MLGGVMRKYMVNWNKNQHNTTTIVQFIGGTSEQEMKFVISLSYN